MTFLNAPAFFTVIDSAFHIKCLTWWDWCYFFGKILEKLYGQDLQYGYKTGNTILTKSSTWCKVQCLWWRVNQRCWEDNFTLNIPINKLSLVFCFQVPPSPTKPYPGLAHRVNSKTPPDSETSSLENSCRLTENKVQPVVIENSKCSE